MWILAGIVIAGSMFTEGRGVKRIKDGVYLTGGWRGGYVVYCVPVPEGAYEVKASVVFSRMRGDASVYVRMGREWRLWEGTELHEWHSSRPEYLPVEEDTFCLMIRADGGFFSRERFWIKSVAFDFKTLKIPQNIYERAKEEGARIRGRYLYVEAKGLYTGSESQRRALARRAAVVEAMRKATRILGTQELKNFEVMEEGEEEDGIRVVLMVPIPVEEGNDKEE